MVVQARDGYSLGKEGSPRGAEEWSDPGYILSMKPKGFATGWNHNLSLHACLAAMLCSPRSSHADLLEM